MKMHIHIGNNRIVSLSRLIGIFNRETLEMSDENRYILKKTESNNKTVAVDENNSIISSAVSPFTIIKRKELVKDFFWRRKDDKRV